MDLGALPGYSGAPVLTVPNFEVVAVLTSRALEEETGIGFTVAYPLSQSDLTRATQAAAEK